MVRLLIRQGVSMSDLLVPLEKILLNAIAKLTEALVKLLIQKVSQGLDLLLEELGLLTQELMGNAPVMEPLREDALH